MTSSKKVFIIDGSAFLYRAFHAVRSLSTTSGHPTNASFGFTRMLLKLLQDTRAQYAVVLFDAKGPTFRHNLYDQYKANRPLMPEQLSIQIPDIKEIIAALNIVVVEKTGFEADDLAGTYAKLACVNGFETILVTGDKDFIQLVTNKCSLFDPMKDIKTNPDTIKEQMQIEPKQFIEVLGLAGDSADNIPGALGVGMKTALKLIQKYGSIESLYENINELEKQKKLYQNLIDNKENVFLSRELATIKTSISVKENIDDFKLKEFDREKAFEIFQRLEFKSLAAEFAKKADKSYKDYRAVTKTNELEKLAKVLCNKELFAIDTETTSKDPINASLVGISFSFRENQSFYIPIGHQDETKQPDKEEILRIFKPVLENPDIKKIGQNIKYDYIVLKNFGICMKGIFFDTMIASYLLNPLSRRHGLDNIAMDIFGYKTISYEEVTGKGKNQITFDKVKISNAVDYACEDADLTFMAYQNLEKRIKEQGFFDLMQDIEMPLIIVLADMEMTGIKVDENALKQLSKTFATKLRNLEIQIYADAKEEFNINSSQQLGHILFEKLKLKSGKKTKKKTAYSTDVNVLTKLAQTHELPLKILEYRTLDKLKSTYADSLRRLINQRTQRIHTSFNQTITVTGRLSSSKPNLQNIPIREKEGRKIRQAFIPKKDCVLVSADYSQIELRILAHCSEDEILIKAFHDDEDIHQRTASEIFGYMFITDKERAQAKAINFGIIYGMTAFGLSKDINVSLKMAKNFIDKYFKRYAGVKKFIDKTIEDVKQSHEIHTIFGRKRRLDDIHSSDPHIRNFAQRAAINTPIQGSAADLMKLAMIKMYNALKKNKMDSKMLLSVHDEIIFETPIKEKQELIALTKEVMENVYQLKVPLKINLSEGENWAQAH